MPKISNYKIKGLNLRFSALTALRNTTILAFFKGRSLRLISPISAYSIVRSIIIIVIINIKLFKSI